MPELPVTIGVARAFEDGSTGFWGPVVRYDSSLFVLVAMYDIRGEPEYENAQKPVLEALVDGSWMQLEWISLSGSNAPGWFAGFGLWKPPSGDAVDYRMTIQT